MHPHFYTPTNEYFHFCVFPGLAGKPLKYFYLCNGSVDRIFYGQVFVTSTLRRCYVMNTCTSLCHALSKGTQAFTAGPQRGSLGGNVEVSVASCVNASTVVCKHLVRSKARGQKYACSRNKGKESRSYRSGCSLPPLLNRKGSCLFGQSRVFLSYFLKLGKWTNKRKKKNKQTTKPPQST